MRPAVSLDQIAQAVSDGTGLTQEEVWVFGTAAVLAVALSGLVRAVDTAFRVVDAVSHPLA
jgi:hypothetical protein